MKTIRIFLLVLIIIGIIALCTQSIWVPRLVDKILVWEGVYPPTVSDYKTAAYIIEDAPAQYFGNEAMGDLNGDGVADVGFILTQNNGGSGTFYYATAAIKTADGYVSTNAILLGDRIAPQTTEIKGGQLIVNYADRKKGEPMTAVPSVGVSKYLEVLGDTLVVVR